MPNWITVGGKSKNEKREIFPEVSKCIGANCPAEVYLYFCPANNRKKRELLFGTDLCYLSFVLFLNLKVWRKQKIISCSWNEWGGEILSEITSGLILQQGAKETLFVCNFKFKHHHHRHKFSCKSNIYIYQSTCWFDAVIGDSFTVYSLCNNNNGLSYD